MFASNSRWNYPIILETDTLDIKELNYSKSTADSSVTINIEYPQISGLENKDVETKINSLGNDWIHFDTKYDKVFFGKFSFTTNLFNS